MDQAVETATGGSKPAQETKFCQHCGGSIAKDAILCPLCGRQVEELRQSSAQQVVVNNNLSMGRMRKKWVAFLLCLFLGAVGAHKFYEGKPGMGILYLLTFGLFGIGWLVDCIVLLCKPNPYYV